MINSYLELRIALRRLTLLRNTPKLFSVFTAGKVPDTTALFEADEKLILGTRPRYKHFHYNEQRKRRELAQSCPMLVLSDRVVEHPDPPSESQTIVFRSSFCFSAQSESAG